MKVTIYTINDCKFSEAERAYLKQNNVEFEEKNLETNRDFLTEMLAISNNFAGTPVTEVVKDSGEKIILKGFTAEEFDKALGVSSVVVTPTTPTPNDMPTGTAMPATPEPQATPPVGVESLSQDTSDIVSSDSESLMPPSEPQPVSEPPIPMTPVVEENIGPISLDVTTPTTEQPAMPAPNPLDSVLQNLQNQVGTPEPKKDDAQPPAA